MRKEYLYAIPIIFCETGSKYPLLFLTDLKLGLKIMGFLLLSQ